MRNSIATIHTTHGLILFPVLTMPVKTASKKSAKPQAVLTDDALTITPKTTITLTAFVDHPSEWHATGAVTPLNNLQKQPVC